MQETQGVQFADYLNLLQKAGEDTGLMDLENPLQVDILTHGSTQTIPIQSTETSAEILKPCSKADGRRDAVTGPVGAARDRVEAALGVSHGDEQSDGGDLPSRGAQPAAVNIVTCFRLLVLYW